MTVQISLKLSEQIGQRIKLNYSLYGTSLTFPQLSVTESNAAHRRYAHWKQSLSSPNFSQPNISSHPPRGKDLPGNPGFEEAFGKISVTPSFSGFMLDLSSRDELLKRLSRASCVEDALLLPSVSGAEGAQRVHSCAPHSTRTF